jgi:D-arabinose 1-dehydrogenase-like Zn-dependent alcohol dehydrogenase
VILNERDAIIKITSTAICGSDLHLYDGYIPTMEEGDILGHEFMGNVVGSEVWLGRWSASGQTHPKIQRVKTSSAPAFRD